MNTGLCASNVTAREDPVVCEMPYLQIVAVAQELLVSRPAPAPQPEPAPAPRRPEPAPVAVAKAPAKAPASTPKAEEKPVSKWKKLTTGMRKFKDMVDKPDQN